MKVEAVRYSGGVVKIPVRQESTSESAIPRWAIAFHEKLEELATARAKIRELEGK